MQQLSKSNEMKVNFIIAREFIEEKLGIEPTAKNLSLFVNHIIQFEQQVQQCNIASKKSVAIWYFIKRLFVKPAIFSSMKLQDVTNH